MCVILVAVASSGSEIIEEDPGGPLGRRKQNKARGLNRVKVIFHEETKVAKRYRRKKNRRM